LGWRQFRGFFGAALFGAFILPLATAYYICEAFGWESGINREYKDAKTFYNIIERHIQRRGNLSQRFVERLMTVKQVENGKFLGYCQKQGMYLAARNYGQLEVFNQAKENVSNCKIPHF